MKIFSSLQFPADIIIFTLVRGVRKTKKGRVSDVSAGNWTAGRRRKKKQTALPAESQGKTNDTQPWQDPTPPPPPFFPQLKSTWAGRRILFLTRVNTSVPWQILTSRRSCCARAPQLFCEALKEKANVIWRHGRRCWNCFQARRTRPFPVGKHKAHLVKVASQLAS